MITLPAYCPDTFTYHRRKTREVKVGDVGIGGDNPIRIQSMTISDTMDTAATVAETIELVEAGCEIVRITAPSLNEAENLRNIKAELKRQGVKVPLIADIHFTPNAALLAAEYVEKVRINPGNYADKKKFAEREYTDSEYEAELERIEARFKPLVLKVKQYGVAMRIGTNHGSLSDRIMNRFGDTPQGMVESALEFLRICRRYDYHDIILSMKASNPLVMIQAYRLLATRMDDEGMDYPFHLGVTEAGDGEEGRIKSAVGIGSLLEDGVGDTIRVSLTEDAVHEIPAAQTIAKPYNSRLAASRTAAAVPVQLRTSSTPSPKEARNPYGYIRRTSDEIQIGDLPLGGAQPVRVELAATVPLHDIERTMAEIENLTVPADANDPVCEIVRLRADSAEDLVALDTLATHLRAAEHAVPLSLQIPAPLLQTASTAPQVAKFITMPEAALAETAWREQARDVLDIAGQQGTVVEWALSLDTIPDDIRADYGETFEALARTAARLVACAPSSDAPIMLSVTTEMPVQAYRYIAAWLDAQDATVPLHLTTPPLSGHNDTLFQSAIGLGTLLSDGIGDSILIDSDCPPRTKIGFCYNILQAARLRMSKTELISCPSCGRTLFNLQTTTERIKSQMSHLKETKIAIMGCIVNGPGEMADADFGYVGSGPGKISLYVGKDCVERNIPDAQADERLIQLIKYHGKWVDPA
ncbi:(E)-4-hydroxy-3-methylbut-2-enyl-diphosphate synthase [Candidatus Entotheonella palauensis]|uniref:(E)-4-hydroxy-3-methylbut-2-enyl-diphosphate synthase n=1 Tax=Candidatus Entotheonella palauensis TaxID=93172 RepID=UPI000B7CC385|nr:(E)-4-hydroxy-3-methylbut-2-enyl-diphosphate synthase [Candidatus Entotheonella palauensis]